MKTSVRESLAWIVLVGGVILVLWPLVSLLSYVYFPPEGSGGIGAVSSGFLTNLLIPALGTHVALTIAVRRRLIAGDVRRRHLLIASLLLVIGVVLPPLLLALPLPLLLPLPLQAPLLVMLVLPAVASITQLIFLVCSIALLIRGRRLPTE